MENRIIRMDWKDSKKRTALEAIKGILLERITEDEKRIHGVVALIDTLKEG